ncbi:MAG: hypothetical protein RQ733_08890 [Methyloprofundus sp.]|nr:hypothetical protein [Methyloprofundus sp.]MDT8426075.1 hypothetical protein [Methyloprofundus sp.]
MRLRLFGLLALLFIFASPSYALNVGEWEYESVTGNLKPTAGCKDKAKAEKQASTGYRFEKYTTELCNAKGYGWGKSKVVDKGELVCEACEGEYEGAEKYRCYMKNVDVECKMVKRGW